MSEITEAEAVVIEFYETVPYLQADKVIRLPRCQNCFDELHDSSFGKAYCIPIGIGKPSKRATYVRMDAEHLARWNEVEREEQERRERGAK